MLKKPKSRWLKALRSGDFRQTTGDLHAFDEEGHHSYCCLGVLRNVCGLKGKQRYDEFLTKGQLAKVGLDDDAQKTLAHMNDNGKSFSEIADYIDLYY